MNGRPENRDLDWSGGRAQLLFGSETRLSGQLWRCLGLAGALPGSEMAETAVFVRFSGRTAWDEGENEKKFEKLEKKSCKSSLEGVELRKY